jgi:uncharacterized protein YjlB
MPVVPIVPDDLAGVVDAVCMGAAGGRGIDSEDRKAALKTIPRVGRPRKDPVYGGDGPLRTVWRAKG